jgi:hypothetical protein
MDCNVANTSGNAAEPNQKSDGGLSIGGHFKNFHISSKQRFWPSNHVPMLRDLSSQTERSTAEEKNNVEETDHGSSGHCHGRHSFVGCGCV